MNSIAIDGPAGAGKSTIAKEAAKKLGYIYVDTGALYRATALYVIKHIQNTQSKEEVVKQLPNIDVSLEFKDNIQKVILCGEDVSDDIRNPEVSMAASNISSIKEVRAFLLDLQRNIAKKNNVIMDGRDIGTVVLPNAQVKIFLTASTEKRAERRYKDLEIKGIDITYDEVLSEIKKRDFQDENREIAPLKPADDAVIIDTSDKTFSESIDYVVSFIKGQLD